MFYALYDTKNSGFCVGTFDTYEEAGEYVGLSGDEIYRAIRLDNLINKRYKARKIEEE